LSEHLDHLIRAMSDPTLYPHRPQTVRVVQTHISVVFIADELVYKIKKPLNLGFLDFTTLQKREYFCNREVELNSRFSEGVYLAAVPIHSGPEGVNLKGNGPVIDWAVMMRHLPEELTLVKMLQDDRVTLGLLDRLADRLALLHAQAPTSAEIALHGAFDAIFRNIKENFDQTEAYQGRSIRPEDRRAIFDLSREFMETRRSLIHSRITRGFIRDCHGDLHADHVVILNGIILYDCIEFNDRFRYGDTASDLAFLLMDLDFRGYPAFSQRVANRYAETSADYDALDLLALYKSYRGFVRGKVAGFTLDESEVPEVERRAAGQVARDYFALSLAYLKPPPPPALIVMSGLMGSGKSYLAAKLGRRLGVEPIRSDVVRKSIYGIDSSVRRLDNYGHGIYRTNATGRTYAALLDAARRTLARGETVVLDASFMRRADRKAAQEVAEETGARFRLVVCDCRDDIIRARLLARIGKANEPSDGRIELLDDQMARFEPISPKERRHAATWDSTDHPDLFLKPFVRDLIAG
jgi:hypothetical protein